jgi:hypothetical protein
MARNKRRGSGSSSLTDRVPLKLGAVFGVGTYVVGFIVTFVLVQIDSELDASEFDGLFGLSPDVSSLDLAGWVFYNAHFVDTEFSASGGDGSNSESSRIIAENSTQIPEVVFYIVPILLLVGAGYLLVQQEYVTEGVDAALSGGSLVIGYLPLAVIGTFLFTASNSTSVAESEVTISFGPATGTGILLAGIIFPLVLGAVGGLIAFQTQDNRRGGLR